MGQTQSALVSSAGEAGVFIVGPLNVSSYGSLEVTNYFGMSSSTWNSTNSYMKLSYSIDNETYTEVTRTGSNPKGAVNSNKNLVQASYSLPAAAKSSTLYLKFEFYCYQLNNKSAEIGQAYFDEVDLTGVYTSSDPSISLSSSSENVTTAEGDGTINVTYTNIDVVDAEVSFYESDGTTPATYDWIIADINASNNLEYAYEANTGAARTAYMKVHQKNTDVYSSLITIAQGGVYTVTYETEQENGTLVVKNGKDEVASGSKLAAGTILTIETTPAENYVFRNWQYKKGTDSWQTKTAYFEYTMDENDVEFRANFDFTYPVNFIVNGQIASTARFAKDKKIDFPGSVTEYDGYTFIGWTETPVVGTVADEPTLVNTTTEKMGTEEKTYYAVYAKTTSAMATFDPDDLTDTPSSGDRAWTHTATGTSIYLSAGQHYTAGTPKTFTVTKGTSNYLEVTAPTDFNLSKITVTISGTNYKIGSVSTGASLSTSGTTQTVTFSSDLNSVQCKATSDYQIRATSIVVEAEKTEAYCTSIVETATVTAAGYATYVTKNNVEFAVGDAYTVSISGNKAVLNEVTRVQAGTAVVLKGEGTKTATVLTETPDAVDNDLKVSDGSVAGDGSTIYVLAEKKSGVGFYLLKNGVTIPDGKAYLVVAGDSAREFIGFEDGETTAISEVRGLKSDVRGEFYNLNGQRVAQPSKGLYIVNGKKVMFK